MYTHTHTQPAMDAGINCQMEEFDLDILKARLDAMAPQLGSQQDEGTLPRIPLVQETGPINEIMTEQEVWDILNRYNELYKLYTTAYHELAIHARYSMIERIEACSLLEPYILNVLEQVGAALPFEETFKPERTRAIEEQRRKQQPLLSTTTTTQEITEIQTRPTTTTKNLLQFNQHQAMTPLCVINTHMTNHVLQQQNTPTREHHTSHLSGHSTPIWQRTTNTAATVTNIILKTDFNWTKECQECFQILKEVLQKAPILRYPDPQASYTLYMDASKYAYARVLTQTREETDYPIAYVSGLFRGSELNWAALTKEAYAIYMSVNK